MGNDNPRKVINLEEVGESVADDYLKFFSRVLYRSMEGTYFKQKPKIIEDYHEAREILGKEGLEKVVRLRAIAAKKILEIEFLIYSIEREHKSDDKLREAVEEAKKYIKKKVVGLGGHRVGKAEKEGMELLYRFYGALEKRIATAEKTINFSQAPGEFLRHEER